MDGETLFNFLISFSGLENLYLTGKESFKNIDTSCLAGHRDSLVELAILPAGACDCDGWGSSGYLMVPAGKFASTCSSLTQLGLMLPVVGTKGFDADELELFDEVLLPLLSLPNLRLLRSYTWLEYSENFRRYDPVWHRKEYLEHVDGFMVNMYERMKAEEVSDHMLRRHELDEGMQR